VAAGKAPLGLEAPGGNSDLNHGGARKAGQKMHGKLPVILRACFDPYPLFG
jgi:hypothetical protein